MKIRFAQVSDLPDIRKVFSAWYVDEHGNPSEKDINYFCELIKNSIENKVNAVRYDEKYIVAEDNEIIVGILGFKKPIAKIRSFSKLDTPVSLEALFILPEYKNKGIGKLLIVEMEKIVKVHGYNEILVRSANRFQDSWGFYDKLNFERAGNIKSDSGENIAQVWRKDITDTH